MNRKHFNQNLLTHRSKYVVIFLTLLIVGVVIWIFASIYETQNTSVLPPEVNSAASPLDPNLNTMVLDVLSNKPIYSTEELASFPIYIITTDRFTRNQSIELLE